MKLNKLQHLSKVKGVQILLIILLISISCSDEDSNIVENDDTFSQCISPPLGDIVGNELNLTIYAIENYPWVPQIENLSEISLVYEDYEMPLHLIKTNEFSLGTDWQTIPSLNIYYIKVKIDGQFYSIKVDGIDVKTNKIFMRVHKTSESLNINFEDYKKCVSFGSI